MTTDPIYAESPAVGERFGEPATGFGVSGLGSIEFRVLRTGAPARRMRLHATRCTFGSGEDCTVRLHDASLRAMHAVILRDVNRVLLRAYTVPIEVNGHLTAETFLYVGDTFRLGSYSFQFVDGLDTLPPLPPERANWERDSVVSGSEFSTLVDAQDDSPTSRPKIQPRSVFTNETSDRTEVANKKIPGRIRPRLSFQGGGTFVSEAVQGILNPSATSLASPSSHIGAKPVDIFARGEQKDELEQLRKDLNLWRQKEADWKEQQQRTNRELELAISRFHHSQAQATEASESVSELRDRIGHLTSELESLVDDTRSYRQREKQLRNSVEAAAVERERAIRERDEAVQLIDEVKKQCADAERMAELARQEREDAFHQADLLGRERQAENRQRELESANRSELVAREIQSKESLAHANRQLQSLTEDLARATAQLMTAKQDAEHNHRRIDELARQSDALRVQLAKRDESSGGAIREREQKLESLQTQLVAIEKQRQADHQSWEQEAEALQQTIQQLSIEIASVTGQWHQSQANFQSLTGEHATTLLEYEATQAELNQAYERLTVARRELTERPTAEQWNELQAKLEATESLLEDSEKQLAALRLEYNAILERPTAGPVNAPVNAPVNRPSSTTHSISTPPKSNKDDSALQQLPNRINAAIDDADAGDLGWPTYGKPSAAQNQDALGLAHSAMIGESSPTPEEWAANEQEVADRLRSYTSHDESQRHAPADSEFEKPIIWPRSSPVGSDLPMPIAPPEFPAPQMDFAEGPNESEEPALSGFAQRLIAELEGSRTASLGTQSTKIRTTDSTASWSSEKSVEREPAKPAPLDPAENRFAVTFPEQPVAAAPSLQEWERQPKDAVDADSHITESNRYTPISEMDQESFERTYVLSGKEESFGSLAGEDHLERPSTYLGSEPVVQDSHEDESDGQTRAFDFQSFDSKPFAASSFPITHEPAAAPEPTSAQEKKGHPSVEAAKSSTEEEDDSIEAYMNRLLQRVQGHSVSSPEPSTPKPSSAKPITESISSFTASTEVISRDAETVSLSKPVEIIDPNAPLIPRSQAPEAAKNLAAMRELANSTADSAISLSVRGQAQNMKTRAILDLLQGAVVLICAFAFFACGVQIPSLRYVWFTAAALAAALAAFFVLDMIKKLSAAKRTYDKSLGRVADDASDEDKTKPM